jgi:thymidylate synthase ThyX
MEHERQIYLLDPQKLPPETIAVTFAKTSRSPESFRQIAAELSDSKSAEFNEKWVVGYGHSSVAEHAVLHLAVENVSRLAIECLQSNRLASYTEKSTRYQTWLGDAFYIPDEIKGSVMEGIYRVTCEKLFATYQAILPSVESAIRAECPQQEQESASAWERRTRSQAVDVCRFLLPSASLANVGITINARALEHAITKMLSHPLAEVRQVGAEIKVCATASVPTLLKYASVDDALNQVSQKFASIPLEPSPAPTDWCQLFSVEPNCEQKIFAAALYKEQNIAYAQALDWANKLSAVEKVELAKVLLDPTRKHSIPARELEHSLFTFDVLLDQGAYYEVKRHRMMTLTPQSLTARLGFATPMAIEKAGVRKEYEEAMKAARTAYSLIAQANPEAASYVVPNGFNRRFLITTNFRSLVHFIQLRSAANAHFSVRRLAQRMSEEIAQCLPSFANLLPRNQQENTAGIVAAFFFSTNER